MAATAEQGHGNVYIKADGRQMQRLLTHRAINQCQGPQTQYSSVLIMSHVSSTFSFTLRTSTDKPSGYRFSPRRPEAPPPDPCNELAH